MKIELKREIFENSERMTRFKDRKFLLVFISILQATVIILMLGLLVFFAPPAEDVAPAEKIVPPFFAPSETAEEPVDWLRLILDLFAVALILTITLIATKVNIIGTELGRRRWNWGEESLLRENGDGLWYFGP